MTMTAPAETAAIPTAASGWSMFAVARVSAAAAVIMDRNRF